MPCGNYYHFIDSENGMRRRLVSLLEKKVIQVERND
jgi:hypothetical protein